VTRENEWIDPAEAGLRLILTTSAAPPDDPQLSEALAAAPIAAIVVPPALLPAWRTVRDAAGWALLVLDDADAATAADGVHLQRPERIAEARRRLGAERILGVAAGESRHGAMVAGEAGADYVLLGPRAEPPDRERLAELVGWWSELFVLPGAVGPVPDAWVAELRQRGLDFLVAELTDSPRLRELTQLVGRVGANV
jgi:thiamine-phosphate pyrophosphorylase